MPDSPHLYIIDGGKVLPRPPEIIETLRVLLTQDADGALLMLDSVSLLPIDLLRVVVIDIPSEAVRSIGAYPYDNT